MDLLEKYITYNKKQNLFQPKDHLLLAVSGGLDSVVLCELCKQAGYDFSIAHCNFQLRGEESDRDEKFVEALAKKYGVPFFLKKFDTVAISKTGKKSIEETARDLRYKWFYELLELLKTSNLKPQTTNLVLTAHHADDNIETLLMNFFRGTGIKGLHGILPKQGQLIRPLLFATRKELETFAEENKLAFVTDSTNAENEYTRNFFRNKIIPLVSERFPEAKENLVKNIQRFGETEVLYRQAIALHKKKLMEQKGNEIHIPVLKLMKTKPLPSVLYEIISEFGFTAHQAAEVIALLESESGKYIQSPTHRIIKNRKWLIISPNETKESQTILIENENDSIEFPAGKLEIKKLQTSNLKFILRSFSEGGPQTSNNIAQLDLSHIKFPLLLRKWKQGDYFYPLGMNKKRNSAVSSLIINCRLLKKKEYGSLNRIRRSSG